VLVPVKREDLSQDQLKKVVRSHMFLKEKFEDGSFVKLKACLVAWSLMACQKTNSS
jgi:hypothetical protein